jgi:hypothetical protein
VKRLTLDINERLEEEDYQEMLAQVCLNICKVVWLFVVYFNIYSACDDIFTITVRHLEHFFLPAWRCLKLGIQRIFCFAKCGYFVLSLYSLILINSSTELNTFLWKNNNDVKLHCT